MMCWGCGYCSLNQHAVGGRGGDALMAHDQDEHTPALLRHPLGQELPLLTLTKFPKGEEGQLVVEG